MALKVAPVLSIVVRPRLRELRGKRTLVAMAETTGVSFPILSQIERGQMLPRPRDMAGLEQGYGPPETWYAVSLEER